MGKITVEQMERRIAKVAIKGLIDDGYHVAVYDGEIIVLPRTDKPKVIIDAMFATDEDFLFIYQQQDDKWRRNGMVRFAYGNQGWDVIADYTFSIPIEKALSAAKELADTLEERYG